MKRASMWFLAAVVAVPIAVLAHEGGHVATYSAFGFPEAALHYDSSTHALEEPFWSAYREGGLPAASRVAAPWKMGVAVSAGLIATYAMVIACCIAVARSPHPLAVAAAMAANVRIIPVAISSALTRGQRSVRGTDEAHLAAITGIPEVLLVLFGIASLIASALWVFRRVSPRERTVSVVSTITGLVVGLVLYLIVGPLVLP